MDFFSNYKRNCFIALLALATALFHVVICNDTDLKYAKQSYI